MSDINIEQKICTINKKFNIGMKEYNKGKGFFCKIPSKNINLLITSNQIINNNFLDKEIELKLYVDNKEKIINLKLNRYIYIDTNLEFTLIEILKEDKIADELFLEVDENINMNLNNYKFEIIKSFGYDDKGINNFESNLEIKNNENNIEFLYNNIKNKQYCYLGTPIILKKNSKLIGLFKKYNNKIKNINKNKNILTPIFDIINKIKKNFIKCTYNIKKENVGKEIQIINNGYYDFNEEYRRDIDIIYDENIYDDNYELKSKGEKFILAINEIENNDNYDKNKLEENIKKFVKKNNEIKNKIKIMKEGKEGEVEEIIILNNKYKFEEKGIYKFYIIIDISIKDLSCLFSECECLEEIDFSSFNTEKIVNMSYLFNGCSSLKKINLSNFNTTNVENMSNMFRGCKLLKKIYLLNFNTEKVKDMSGLFDFCTSLKNINLSSFNTENVTNMNSMFSNCSNLKSINISSFKTDNVTDMAFMFNECTSLKTINFLKFETNNVTNMAFMFNKCYKLREILSTFKTDKVTNMSYMFNECSNLKNIDLSQFKADNVQSMEFMFKECKKIKNFNLPLFKIKDDETNINGIFDDISKSKINTNDDILKEIHKESTKCFKNCMIF